MKVKNKWNGLIYEVLEMQDIEVTLKRSDNSVFTIQKSIFLSTYVEIKDKKCIQK